MKTILLVLTALTFSTSAAFCQSRKERKATAREQIAMLKLPPMPDSVYAKSTITLRDINTGEITISEGYLVFLMKTGHLGKFDLQSISMSIDKKPLSPGFYVVDNILHN